MNFSVEEVEARGVLCVECLGGVGEEEALVDRFGAALCRACAVEFYAACVVCGGLVARDEAVGRASDGAPCCPECFPASAAPDAAPPPTDEEVAALVAEYVALHEEAKRAAARMDEIKERLKTAAARRPRASNAVVLRAGEGGATVRCGYSVRTSYDAAQLTAVEEMLGRDTFGALFERKVTFSAVKDGLEEFLSSTDEAHAAAREAVRAAEQRSEVVTLSVVAQKKKKGT